MALVSVRETFATTADAHAFKVRYERNYHPAGYGTRLSINTVIGRHPETGADTTQFVVSGHRYSSCD